MNFFRESFPLNRSYTKDQNKEIETSQNEKITLRCRSLHLITELIITKNIAHPTF